MREKKIEKEIVKKAKNGDQEAFSWLYQKYGEQIFRFIYWRTSDKHLAEDLLQEVFLKAWDKIESYKERNLPIKAWFYRIARNTVIDHYRTKKSDFSLDDVSVELASYKPDLAEKIDTNIEIEKIKKAINLLPDTQKEVIVLKFIEELTNKEIAKILKKSEGAIRLIQFRALRHLKEILKDL